MCLGSGLFVSPPLCLKRRDSDRSLLSSIPSQEAAIKTSSAAAARLALSGDRGAPRALERRPSEAQKRKNRFDFSPLHGGGKREKRHLQEGGGFLATVTRNAGMTKPGEGCAIMKGNPGPRARARVPPTSKRQQEMAPVTRSQTTDPPGKHLDAGAEATNARHRQLKEQIRGARALPVNGSTMHKQAASLTKGKQGKY